jgi:large subunit ribosomal protein L24
MKIRKNDTVLIIAGKDNGKKGKVRQVFPREGKLIVEGFNMIKRHSRTKGQAKQGGIIQLEAPLNISNVMIICSKCGKPARVGFNILDDGKKVRICRNCKEAFD